MYWWEWEGKEIVCTSRIHTFIHILKSSVMIVRWDELNDRILLSVIVPDCEHVFFLSEIHTWLTIFHYMFYNDHFTSIWFTYLYAIGPCQPMMPISMRRCIGAIVFFVEFIACFVIWDKASSVANSSRFIFKGEYHDQATFGTSIHHSCPLFQD